MADKPAYEEMTLLNVCGGAAEQSFQGFLGEIANDFAQYGEWQTDKDGNITSEVTVSLYFIRDRDGGVAVLSSGKLKRPKRRVIDRGTAHYKDGMWLVSNPEQASLPLFDSRKAADASENADANGRKK